MCKNLAVIALVLLAYWLGAWEDAHPAEHVAHVSHPAQARNPARATE